MPIMAKSGGSFELAPEGTHSAVCVDVVDLGDLTVVYGGKEKTQHKVKIVWQIDEARKDGKPFQVNKRYTCSLHEKANLRKDLESWRGRGFTDEECAGFDIEALVGVSCMLNLIHNKGSKGDTFANVSGVMKLPRNTQPLKSRDYTREIYRTPEQKTEEPPAYSDHLTDEDVPFN